MTEHEKNELMANVARLAPPFMNAEFRCGHMLGRVIFHFNDCGDSHASFELDNDLIDSSGIIAMLNAMEEYEWRVTLQKYFLIPDESEWPFLCEWQFRDQERGANDYTFAETRGIAVAKAFVAIFSQGLKHPLIKMIEAGEGDF